MKGNIYFPGLHALRFIAACLVIFHHVHQYKYWMDLPNIWGHPVIDALGHKAVSFFFVLSGFLISFLLLSEFHKTKKINVSMFYLKRILRIWPLYLLITVLALWIIPYFFPHEVNRITETPYSSFTVLALFAFVPNLLRIVNPMVVGANQLWSVGIEEQFYLIWPLLMRAFIRSVPTFLITFTLLKLVLHFMLFVVSENTSIVFFDQLLQLYALFPVEQMAIGALGAYLLFNRSHGPLQFVRGNAIFSAALLIVGLLAMAGLHFIGLSYVEGILFTVIILNVIHRKNIYQILEHKIFVQLGNISYGIYMYHSLVIFLVINALQWTSLPYSPLFNLLIYLLSVTFTLILSFFSYHYFEKPFLHMKKWISSYSFFSKSSVRG